METPIPNPFNGAEMFNGQSHHRNPGHPGPFDDEDFGPETDVDMVDDVLLSPAIAAAKALVHGANEDDFERQRQQMKEFDDPGDLERSRDTPTPPAHEVARDASGENLAESGGEESEEEWNYIPGKDTHDQASAQAESKQEEEDMNSQLNPNAAEFVPVSPTRPLMDDPIIASSPARGFEKSLDNIQLPSELDFASEISQRPSDLEYSNGPKHGDDYFDNFTALQNKSKGFNLPSACSELANESENLHNNVQESVQSEKLAAIQNIEEKVTSAVLEKANIFGANNEFSNDAFEAKNIFGKSDPMTASFMGKDLPSSPESEEVLVPGTPRSTTVEAPSSPNGDEITPVVHETALDSPADDLVGDIQKSPDLISPGDGPQEGPISVQERTSSSGFESESGADEIDPNVVSNEGFISEHRRSPPVDLSFKPIQTFSDTNPFGVLQTPSSTTPLDQFDIPVESHLETPVKDFEANKHGDQFDFMNNAPSSFVSPRFHAEAVPFNQLESPTDDSAFVQPPNANSSFLATELPESLEGQDGFETFSPSKSEHIESEYVNYKTNVNDIAQSLFSDDTNPEIEETSFTTEKPQVSEELHIELDTTEGFLETESKIMQDESECEQTSKLVEDLKFNSELHGEEGALSPVSPKAVEQVLAAFDNIKVEPGTERKHEFQEGNGDSDIEVETKEMKLEFESHIAHSSPTPVEINNLDEGFEVISKDELSQSNVEPEDINKHVESNDDSVIILKTGPEDIVDLTSPVKETNPFKIDEDSAQVDPVHERLASPFEPQNTVNNEFLSSIEQFNKAVNEDIIPSENYVQLSSQLEPEATKTVSYQTLTPANEPQITKSESYVTGEEGELESSALEQIVPDVIKPAEIPPSVEEEKQTVESETSAVIETEAAAVLSSTQKIEPVQSTVVTETLITALEETSEVPSLATTEVPSSAGTPPPTPAPGLDDSKEPQDTPKTDILVAAVAAAGAVAAGSAILAEKEGKKVKEVTTKKTVVGAKKTPDVLTKSAVKSVAAKAPGRPAATKTTTTTTKPLSTATKPTTATSKTTTSATTKKLTTTAPSKTATTKPGLTAAMKQTTTSTKSVPKQLPISKTTTSTLKLPSKPSTPTSKPTTPTTPKSPLMKSDTAKSPARPGLKSPLASKTLPPKAASDKVAEKKPLTNGDIKPIPKKEVPKKLPSAPLVKPPLTKPTPTTKTSLNKTAGPKPLATTNATKSKPTSATVPKPAPAATKRPSTAPTGRTAVGKDINKQTLSLTKPLLNGKSAPSKTAGGLKKTDSKVNAKPGTKPPPIRKPEEPKKEEEKPVQIQEADVTTTNGFADHEEDKESLKIEDLAPMTVEPVN